MVLFIKIIAILCGPPLYGCKKFHDTDQICLQCWLQWGPKMLAISVLKGTKYACNLKSKSGHLCLQSFSNRTKYACNNRNFIFTRFFQSRDVRSILDIASIYGPSCIWNCKHVKSHLLLRLYPYYVPIIIIIASIFGPFRKIIATICDSSLNKL